MDLSPHIEKFRRRYAEVETALSDPKAFDNPQRAQELSREYARLKELVAQGTHYLKTLADLEQNRALLKSEPAESELALMAKEEITRLEADEKRLSQQIQFGLVPPDPTLPVVYLQRVPEPKTIKNRLHLDILTAEAEKTIGRLTALGATRVGTAMSGAEGGWWQVMADPEGNEFCICRVE